MKKLLDVKTQRGEDAKSILEDRKIGRYEDKPFTVKGLPSYPLTLLPSKKRIAFTLAEVLITLGIIGVVAALTIPTLVANYKNKALSSQLRKSVNTMVNGYKMMIANEGTDGVNGTEFSQYLNGNIDEGHFTNYMKKYFNLGKNVELLGGNNVGDVSKCSHFICEDRPNDNTTTCVFHIQSDASVICQWRRGITGPHNVSCTCTDAGFGNSGRIYAHTKGHQEGYHMPSCALMTQVDGTEVCLTAPGQAFIDVNGFAKGPNVVGADFFEVNFSNTGNVVKTTNSVPATRFGETMENNWEITYY